MRFRFRSLVVAVALVLGLAASARPSFALPNYIPTTLAGWPGPFFLRMEYFPFFDPYDGEKVVYGDSTVIYAPCHYKNVGTNGTVPTYGAFFVDSVLSCLTPSPIVGANNGVVNEGVFTLHGGLHTIIFKADGTDAETEANENDNYYGIQVSAVPTTFLALGSSLTRQQPPNPTVGGGLVSPFYANKDGVRVGWLPASRGSWSAVAVHAVDGANYDIALYDPAKGQTDGFRNYIQLSVRPDSKTELIVMNHAALANKDCDLGVVYASGSGDYIAESRIAPDNVPMAINSSVNGNLAAGQMVAVEEFLHVPSAAVPSVRLRLETTPGVTLRLALVDPLFAMAAVTNFGVLAATDAQGLAVLDVALPTSGLSKNYGLIVYRDMDDGGVAPVAYTLRVISAPNYTNVPLAGWIGTVGVSNGTPTLTSEPATLAGAPTSTKVMFGFRNNGNVSALAGSYRLFLDGVVAVDKSGLILAPDEVQTIQPAFPSIPGGRHTLSFQMDYAGTVSEFDETDNAWGKQWTWTPALLSGSTAARTAPDAHGGWSHLPPDVAPLDNLDGTRATFTPNSSAYWGLTLMMPDAGNTNRLTYYQPGSGPFGAFTTPVLGVTSAPGRTVGLLSDSGVSTTYDAGVTRVTGTGGYNIQNQTSTDLGPLPITTTTLAIGAGQIGRLLSFRTANYLPITLQTMLQNLSGNADLALAVYQHAIGGYGVRDLQSVSFADASGPGGNEEVTRPIQQDLTQVAIVVYKTNAADLGKSVTFAVRTNGGAVAGVDDAAPREVSFALGGENPSRGGGTTLRFALPVAGEASLELYDVAGQRVRTLASGARGAGTYVLDWDGRGDGGRDLANGVYFARFRAGDFTRTLRLSLLR